jgi:hypothetical protein
MQKVVPFPIWQDLSSSLTPIAHPSKEHLQITTHHLDTIIKADDADASSVSSASVSSVQQPQKKPKMKHGFKTTSAKKTSVSAGRPRTAAEKEALKKPGTQPTDRERATTEGAA